MKPVESSQLAAIGYHPETKTLAIEFKSHAKPGAPPRKNSVYHYANVDQEEWDAFQAAKSHGAHFYAHIKPFTEKFPFNKQ